MNHFVCAGFLAAASLLLCQPQVARASFHEWRIAEVYSNPSGTVQFIEFFSPANGEGFLNGITLSSSGHTFTFPGSLPTNVPTGNQRLLVATPGYFQLAGVPPADYNLGVNSFFSTSGDTLNYAGGLDTISFTNAQLALDGLRSLVRSTPQTGASISLAMNSPTNVGGTSGAFPRWENQDNRWDVNRLDGVTALDLLQVINDLIANNQHPLVEPTAGNSPPPFLDVSGDNFVSALDVLQVINRLIELNPPSPPPPELSISKSIAAVPEPSGWTLVAVGVAFVMLVRLVAGARFSLADRTLHAH